MQRGQRCTATFEDINDGQPTKGTLMSKPLTDIYFKEHVRVMFDKKRNELEPKERLVPVEQVTLIEPFHIEYEAVPETLDLLAIYPDGRTEHWSAGIAVEGELTSIEDADGNAVDTYVELEAYGVDRFVLTATHDVEIDYFLDAVEV